MFIEKFKKSVFHLFSRGNKGRHEMAYWRKVQEKEGVFSNSHYQYFYLEHFGLAYEFYAGKRILDTGCGPRGSLEWADNALERVGLDPLADKYLALGAAKHKMRYCSSGSESIPFPDEHFDIVTSFNSLDHVDHLEKTIREIKRITRPGGLFLLLSDLGHEPTPCEPTTFSWDIVKKFKPEFEVLQEQHFEKKEGLYQSILAKDLYDHQDPTPRPGIISARFSKKKTP